MPCNYNPKDAGRNIFLKTIMEDNFLDELIDFKYESFKENGNKNPITNRKKIKLQPEGLPAIWVSSYKYCERCAQYKQCLGVKVLSQKEWDGINEIILKTSAIVNTHPQLSTTI